MSSTGNPTADSFLRQLDVVKRIGTAEQKAQALEWNRLIRETAKNMAAPKADQPQPEPQGATT